MPSLVVVERQFTQERTERFGESHSAGHVQKGIEGVISMRGKVGLAERDGEGCVRQLEVLGERCGHPDQFTALFVVQLPETLEHGAVKDDEAVLRAFHVEHDNKAGTLTSGQHEVIADLGLRRSRQSGCQIGQCTVGRHDEDRN